MHTRIGVAAIVSTLAVGLALSSVAAAGELSKKEYIKAGDDICRQAKELRDDAAQTLFADLPAGQDPTSDQLAQYVQNIEPINQQEIDSLRDLPVPDGDEKRLKKLYKLVQAAFNTIADDPDLLLEADAVFAKANKAANKYGFKVCGS